MGSGSEFPLLAKSPLKPPGRYQDRASAPLMAGRGWKAVIEERQQLGAIAPSCIRDRRRKHATRRLSRHADELNHRLRLIRSSHL